MLAKCGLISELMYSKSTSITGAHASLQVGEGLLEQQLDHPHLGGGELAAFDACGVAAVAAEEVVDHGEHQGRLEHDQAGAAQRLDSGSG